MPTLDLFKARKFHVVKFEDKEFKLPAEYLVEEVERIYETMAQREALERVPVAAEEENQKKQLDAFWSLVYIQLEIMFQHFQPDMNIEEIKKLISPQEALDILGFFEKYRLIHADKTQAENPEQKKNSNKVELRNLRRLLTFMVSNGFSLLELRKLYIDELFIFHDELFFTLERMGKVEKGTYAKINTTNKDIENDAQEIVNDMRRQIFGLGLGGK